MRGSQNRNRLTPKTLEIPSGSLWDTKLERDVAMPIEKWEEGVA